MNLRVYFYRGTILAAVFAVAGLFQLAPAPVVADTQVAPVQIYPNGGSTPYASQNRLVMYTPTEGAAIYYSFDGTDPAPGVTTSYLPTNPTFITQSGTVKARAYKSGLTPSVITTATFNFTAPPFIKIFRSEYPRINQSQVSSNNLYWNVGGEVTSLTLNPGNINLLTDSRVFDTYDSNGGKGINLSPTQTTTYTLTATNAYGSDSQQLTLGVQFDPNNIPTRLPSVTLTPSSFAPTYGFLFSGGSPPGLGLTISPTSSLVSVFLNPGNIDLTSQHIAIIPQPTASTIYTVTATNAAGSSSARLNLVLQPPNSQTLQAPLILPNGGTFSGTYAGMTFADPNFPSGGIMYMSTDGTEPSSPLGNVIFSVNRTTTVKLKLKKPGQADSPTATAVFTLPDVPVLSISNFRTDTPTINAGSQAILRWDIPLYTTPQLKMILNPGNIDVSNAGSNGSGGYNYVSPALTQTTNFVLTATNYYGETATANLTINVNGAPTQLAAPTHSPDSGSYSYPLAVSVNHTDPGVIIRYTLNGSDPTASTPSSVSVGGTVTITSPNTTLKTKAFKLGFTDSTVKSSGIPSQMEQA